VAHGSVRSKLTRQVIDDGTVHEGRAQKKCAIWRAVHELELYLNHVLLFSSNPISRSVGRKMCVL
jgi:hypothetical protein